MANGAGLRAEPAVAIVHDYLTQLGGAERVAGVMAAALPDARLFTSVHNRREVPLTSVGGRGWRASYLQPTAGRLPLKVLLPLLPGAIAALPLAGADLIISSSSGFAHHAHTAGARHVCYCHTPPRFLWEPGAYFQGRRAVERVLAPLLGRLRALDLEASRGVDRYVAVSEHIARRIAAVYRRDAAVVHPPVDTQRFTPSDERSGRFLIVSRLVKTKRVELAIEAANRYELPLDIIGKGPELHRLEALAGDTVRFHGWQPDAVVRRAMAAAAAVVVPGEEDFGLVAVEAQASGRPPVTIGVGGALDIIEDGFTGHLFHEQTPDALAAAMLRARDYALDLGDLRASAARFDVHHFESRLAEVIADRTSARAPVAALA